VETTIFVAGIERSGCRLLLVLEVELGTEILGGSLSSPGRTKGCCETFPFSEARRCECQGSRSKSSPADVL